MSSTKSKKNNEYGKGWSSPFQKFTAPSGATCLLRRPGITGLIKAGILESMDTLTGIVQTTTVPTAEGRPPVDTGAIMKDPKKMKDMMETLDKIAEYVVVNPKLTSPIKRNDKGEIVRDEQGDPVILEEDEREEGLVYTDWIDMEDKAAIMSFAVGGQKDFQPFRPESPQALASVPDGEATADQAE